MPASPPPGPRERPSLRADAARNRTRILAAARSAFRELGTAAPLEEIARRAGVNIATLYRRFPDRDALIAQVVLDGYAVVLEAARAAAQAAETNPLDALETFMLRQVEDRETLVLPLIGGPLTEDPRVLGLQRQIAAALEEVLAAARTCEAVRPDVTAVDLIIASALACRPMPHLPPEQATALVTRHVGVFIDGLRPRTARRLPPAPTHQELATHLNIPAPHPSADDRPPIRPPATSAG